MADEQRIAVYPGTFDPITNGHIDIVRRAASIFDKVIVTLAKNSDKKPLFTVDERIQMIKESVKDIARVEVASFNGLVVEFAMKSGARTIIRGLRAVSDFEYEFQMALMNRKQHRVIDTVYLMPDERYTYLSSSMIREVAMHSGHVECFVPECVLKMFQKKYSINE